MKFKDIKDKSDEYLSQEFGNIELTYNGFFNKLSNIIARMTYNLEEVRQKTEINDNDVYLVEGEAQDRLYSQMVEIKRKAQSKAAGFWTTTDSVPNTYVNTFQLKLKCDKTGMEYTNTEDFRVDENGYAEVPIVAMRFGKLGNVLSQEINTIVTPIFGINTGTNLNEVNGGADIETDDEYRARYLITRGLTVGLTKDDLLRQLLKVNGLIDANIIENYEEHSQDFPVSKVIDEDEVLTLFRKSFAIFVRGGSDVDVANAIALKVNLSIKRYGTTTISVFSDIRGEYDDISFFRANGTKIYYKIQLEGLVDLNTTRTIIEEVLTSARVGSKLTSGRVEDRIYNELDTSKVENLEFLFSYEEDGEFTNSLQLKNDEFVLEVEEVV